MKPNDLQIRIIDSCISIIKTWKNNIDISSPIHYNYISQFLDYDLFDESDDLKEDLDDKLTDLLDIIKNYKYYY